MADNQNIEMRKQRWQNFWEKTNGSNYMFWINYTPDQLERPLLWPEKSRERVEWAWRSYCLHQERTKWLEDDSIPYLDMLTGTEVFAEAFGCKIHRPEDNNPFALPLVHNSSEAAKIKPVNLFSSTLTILFEMADELASKAGPEAVFKMVDVQSPMDIAALIWDKNDFYIALVEEPEAVKELSAKVEELLTAFLDEWFRRYGKGFIAHYPNYYMPYGITLSEDEIGMVSEAVFMEMFYDELVKLSEKYGAMGMHCCANAMHQWNNIKKIPNLKLINLCQPDNVIRKSWECFPGQIAQMPSWCGEGEPWTWPVQHPAGTRMVLEATANSREQALELSEKMRKACGR